MIPVSLYLKNFLSYGQMAEPLDFTQFRLACLSGPNGHGKSALLDAITWAVWGQARKSPGGGKPDEGLIRIGETYMQVEFVFDLSGDRYRVIRSCELRKSGRLKPDLQFQYFDPQENIYRPLTCKTSTETQRRIEQTLRMDYETFINSSFLLQGRADEFTRKKPAQRKEILAEVLGLSRYEALRDLAREKSRNLDKNISRSSGRIETIEQELSLKDENQKKFVNVAEKFESINTEFAEVDQEYKNFQESKKQIETQQVQFDEKQKLALHQQKEIHLAESGHTSLSRQIEVHQERLKTEKEVENRYQRYLEFERRLAELNIALQKHLDLENRKNELQRRLEQEQSRLMQLQVRHQADLKSIEDKISEIDRILARKEEIEKNREAYEKGKQQIAELEAQGIKCATLEKQMETLARKIEDSQNRIEQEKAKLLSQVQSFQQRVKNESRVQKAIENNQKKQNDLKQLEIEHQHVIDQGQNKNTQIEKFNDDLKRTDKAIQEEQEKVVLLKNTEEASCPLCQSALDREHREQLLKKLHTGISDLKQNRNQLKKEITGLEGEISRLRKVYQENEKKLKEGEKVQQEAGRLQSELAEIKSAKEQSAQLEKQIATLDVQLKEQDYAKEEREKWNQLKQELEQVQFDPAQLVNLRQKVEALSSVPFEHKQLLEAGEIRTSLEEKRENARSRLNEVSQSLDKKDYGTDHRQSLEKVETEIKALAYHRTEHEKIEQERKTLDGVAVEWTRLEESRKQLPELEKQHQESKSTLKQRRETSLALQKEMDSLQPHLEKLPEVTEALQLAEARHIQLSAERERLNVELGTLKREGERLEQLEKEKKDLDKQKNSEQKEKGLFDTLTEALGPKGVQALIIENAIPEIQDEANRILSRLTGNRTQVAFECLREKKSGGQIETLDIKISDEMGTRDYELYSGGEAFRTDLAVRIALSRLLARRAGTRLKTLVIDEGFGTQDSEGLEGIVQVIQEIAEEFEKIIVVTHLDTLKDAFPTRIEVTKHPDRGSTFKIVHQ